MSNKQYMKKKPQNKSYSPSTMQHHNFLSPEEIDTNSMGPMYEQIKSEVVSSVLNWLSMYMAADQEDKKTKEEIVEAGHCCECTMKKRRQITEKSSFCTPLSVGVDRSNTNYDGSLETLDSSIDTDHSMTGQTQAFIDSDLIPRDNNMVLTEYRAGQVWPEWCQYIDERTDKNPNKTAAKSPVFFDKVNGRLCVYRRGLVEYPSIVLKSPLYDSNSNVMKHNPKSISEIKKCLIKDKSLEIQQSLTENYFNDPSKSFVKGELHENFESFKINDNLAHDNKVDKDLYGQNTISWTPLSNV